eukprot:CAMPEP_0172419686 /NCGR_PEP_ID=MMETSP1064-20121228/6086_1 /TAXON_ID=202472 /ORGANISM="Aulacoseira subarctica , Strain CCAP 1002/5" /LENGTH=81 /DNA_ID=CAMNT_0013159267 /DNA_START=114 /DNA_END=359 /DNA_ORIENTATION=-
MAISMDEVLEQAWCKGTIPSSLGIRAIPGKAMTNSFTTTYMSSPTASRIIAVTTSSSSANLCKQHDALPRYLCHLCFRGRL